MTSVSDSEYFETTSKSIEFDSKKFEWVSVREASFRLKVTEKTVYNRIDSGLYDSSEIDGKWHVLLPKLQNTSVNNTEANFQPIEEFQKATKTNTELSEAHRVIENLKKELEETNQKLITVTVDLRLSQKDNETYSLLMKEKEKRIAQLEDQVSQEKEHIQAEKSRADMASNQLMNANALIKRRDDAPAQIVEPLESIEALQSRIKELETQPWWRKIIK